MGLQPFTISEPGTVQPHPLVGNFVHFWWSTYFEFLISLHRHDHLSISVICGFIIFCVGLEICTVKSGACYVCFKFLSCLQGSIVDTYKPSTQHAYHIWIWNCLVKVNISWLWPKVSILFAPDSQSGKFMAGSNNSMRILCSTSNIHQPMYYSTYSIQRTIYHRPPPMCQDNWNHQQCKMASW